MGKKGVTEGLSKTTVKTDTGLPTNDETVQTAWRYLNLKIPRWNQVFCLEYNLFMAYSMIKQNKRNKFTVAGNQKHKETDQSRSQGGQ